MYRVGNIPWLATNCYLWGWALLLEYSVMVNSFIELEVLTSLKAAEHPRPKSTQSSAAFAVCLSERESTCCSHEPQIQYSHRDKPVPHLCSATLTCLMSLGSLMPDLLCVTTNDDTFYQWHILFLDVKMKVFILFLSCFLFCFLFVFL